MAKTNWVTGETVNASDLNTLGTEVNGKENSANKGVANGFASLDGGGKVPVSQLPASLMEYQGTFDASANSPSLSNGTGNTGDVYRVSVAGSRNFGAGSITLRVGDYVIYSGSIWERSATTDTVASVAGLTGDVSASSLRGAIATGTPDSTTWLRGDGAWSTLPQSGITRSAVQTISSAGTTLSSAANTDYYSLVNLSGTDSASANTRSFLTFDATPTADSGTSPATWSSTNTAIAGVSINASNRVFGLGSGSFPGNNSLVSSSNAIFAPDVYTIETWLYSTGSTGTVFTVHEFAGANPNDLTVSVSGSNTWFNVSVPNRDYNGTLSFSSPAGTFGTNRWIHIALVQTTGGIWFYVNGVLANSSITLRQYYGASSRQLWLGGNTGNGFFTGLMDNFRLTKNTARYTSNFDPVSSSVNGNTVLLPNASSNTSLYRFKNINRDAGIVPQSGQTIDGLSSAAALSANGVLTLVSDGSNWRTF